MPKKSVHSEDRQRRVAAAYWDLYRDVPMNLVNRNKQGRYHQPVPRGEIRTLANAYNISPDLVRKWAKRFPEEV